MKAGALALLFAAAAFAEEAGAHAEPDMTLWKIVNFALLIGVLGWLIKTKAGPMFAARTEEIRRGIDEAQKMKADAEARAAEIDRRLARIGEEIEALRAHSQAEERSEATRMRNETARELARISSQADQEIASAVKAAKVDLRKHAAGLAVELARAKAADRVTADDQDRLIETFSSNLKSSQ